MTWNSHGIWCGFRPNSHKVELWREITWNFYENPCHIFYRGYFDDYIKYFLKIEMGFWNRMNFRPPTPNPLHYLLYSRDLDSVRCSWFIFLVLNRSLIQRKMWCCCSGDEDEDEDTKTRMRKCRCALILFFHFVSPFNQVN